jgi:hypothetical protein
MFNASNKAGYHPVPKTARHHNGTGAWCTGSLLPVERPDLIREIGATV